MANLVSVRTSTLALVKKLVEGDLVFPDEGEQFVAIQDDLAFSPNFETVENPEIKNDIMAAQQAISGQAPSVTFSHLWKGSGTEGVAPVFGLALEATFGGKRVVAPVVLAAAGSTLSTLEFATADDAANFKKGDGVMVKYADGTTEVSSVASVMGTSVNLSFDLLNIPLGLSSTAMTTTYFPLNSDFPVLDLWHFLEGGTAGLESMQNSRTVTTAITANAKENINATFTFEGTTYNFNDATEWGKFVVTTDNVTLAFTHGSGPSTGTITLDVGESTFKELLDELETKLNAVLDDDVTVTLDDDCKLVFGGTGASTLTFTKTGSSAELYTNLGFGDGDGVPAGTNPNRLVFTYLPSNLKPVFETTPPVISRDQRLYVGKSSGENACLQAPSLSFDIGTPKTLLTSICEPSGNFATVINERTATMSVTSFLEEHDKRFFESFDTNQKISFLFVGGSRSNDGFKPGETFTIYGSEASITSFSLSQVDNVYAIELEVTCFAPGDGTGSIFCGFQ